MVEAFGGKLAQLAIPYHGKPSKIAVSPNSLLFKGLPSEIVIGRYHSLHADRALLPDAFRVTADTDDGVIMAIEHRSEPFAAVQFHPESIMSLSADAGHVIIENAIQGLVRFKGDAQ